MKWNPFNTKIGLALGGGAAKGLAHVGALRAFEEEQLKIHCIAGTSVGALVASYYAFGQPVDQIKSIGAELNFTKIINFTMKKRGLFSTDAIKEMVLRDLGDQRIEDARIPLAICATDVETGEQVVFTQGSLADAICASMAVPGLFVPVEIGGRTLVDGGLVENVPISLLEKMGAGIRIGVHLHDNKHYPSPKSTIDVIHNAINIGMDLRTKDQLKKADVVVGLDLSDFNWTNNADRADELCLQGYQHTRKKIRKIMRYRRANLFHYLVKAFLELVPLKIPEVLKRQYQKIYEKVSS